MNTFHLRILAADHPLYTGECESLIFPGQDGQYGIQAKHSNFISAVEPGVLKYRLPGGEQKVAAVSTGMIKVEDNDVLLLVGTAESPEEIDEVRARRGIDEAKQQLLAQAGAQEYHRVGIKMKRELSRVKAKEFQNQ